MYFDGCCKGYEWRFASHHRTEKSDRLASMRDSCVWLDLDRVGRGPRSATREGERRKWAEEGCLDTPLRKGSGF